MKLTTFILFFPLMVSTVSPVAQEPPKFIDNNASYQEIDSLASTGNKNSFLKKILPPPFTQEQLDKTLNVKLVFTVIVVIVAILVAFQEDRKMKKFHDNNK